MASVPDPEHQRPASASGAEHPSGRGGLAGARRVRGVGRDRPLQATGRPRGVSVRLSEAEFADITVTAREAGLTPSGYAAEAILAAARRVDPPDREPLRVALAEMVATRLDLIRVLQLLRGTTTTGEHSASGEADRQAVLRVVLALDRAATAVARDLP